MAFPNVQFTSGSKAPGQFVDQDVVFFDDFLVGSVEDGGKFSRTADLADWLLTDDADATVVIADDEPGGVLTITTNSNANDFASCQLNGEAFKVASGKDIIFEIRVKFADTDDTRWFVGLATTDVTGTTIGPILDGVTESIGFRQNTDTGVDIFYLCEDASTETTADTGIDLVDDTFVTLGFHVIGNERVKFYVNGTEKANVTTNIPDGDAVTLSLEVHSPTASSTMEVDYIYCAQTR